MKWGDASTGINDLIAWFQQHKPDALRHITQQLDYGISPLEIGLKAGAGYTSYGRAIACLAWHYAEQ